MWCWEVTISVLVQAMDRIPKPKVVQLDPNDPNLIVGYPEEPDVLEPEPQRDGKKVPGMPHVQEAFCLGWGRLCLICLFVVLPGKEEIPGADR